ncbi:MAG: hypothetical protein IKW28_09985 [Lachnospiraceae bacterium]|nr:hypothetical protein [Lachnospiraceae bacterium]
MKRILIAALVLGMVLGIDSQALAAARRENIKSKGSIDFKEGSVVLDSKDLLYLADEVDSLEANYKTGIVNSLNTIGTYFRQDGTIIYHQEDNQVKTEEEKIRLSYSGLLQAIKQSQSLSMLAGVQATNENGENLFYSSQEASDRKQHLETNTTDTGLPLYYKEATADNLSEGCAAWVNGVLIKGNGSDLKSMKEIGYREGYAKGIAEALDKANIVYTYHQHTGEKGVEGGCYGKITKTRPIPCGCRSYAYMDENGTSVCANCGHNHGDVCNAEMSSETYTTIGLICKKTTDTIESATIQY